MNRTVATRSRTEGSIPSNRGIPKTDCLLGAGRRLGSDRPPNLASDMYLDESVAEEHLRP